MIRPPTPLPRAPRLHSETSGIAHAMTELAPAIVVLEAYRGVRGVLAIDGLAAGRALADLPEGYRWLHIGSAEKFLTPPNVLEPGVVISGRPDNTAFAQQIVRGRLSSALLVKQLTAAIAQLLTTLYSAGADLDGVWIDAEDIPNSNAVTAPPDRRECWPGLNKLLSDVFSRLGPAVIDGYTASVIYAALASALGALGIDRRILAAWEISDRTLGWDTTDVVRAAASFPDGSPVQVGRPHMVCTLPNPETTARLERELTAGSGPSRAVVHLSTATPPEVLRDRLNICARLRVPDVILFYQPVDETRPTLTAAQQHAYAIGLLDALLPVIRPFAAAA